MCGSAGSGIWVLKGDLIHRMPVANLDHQSVQWRTRGSYDTAWVTPRPDCLFQRMNMEQQSDHKTKDSIWDGVVGFLRQDRSLFVSMVCFGRGANGVDSEPVRQFRITHPLAQR